MILADTSVWVEHFRRGLPELERRLDAGEVVCHPFVLGELACGNLKNRQEILELLQALCTCQVVSHEEVLAFIEGGRLMGRGLGYIDMHLLASAKLSGFPLWTFDRPLLTAASHLNVTHTSR
jgi:predicted nucleic acid-binding protein